jgi:hypothetical protein
MSPDRDLPASTCLPVDLIGANGHGVSATPENVSRYRHDRFPHPSPLPEGEGDPERAARDFHRNLASARMTRIALYPH